MDKIIEAIDAELTRLLHARAILAPKTNSQKANKPHKPTKPGRRKISAEGRARIAAAQKARWAKFKRG